MKESLPRDVRGQHECAGHAFAACDRLVCLQTWKWRWSGGFASRALVRAQALADTSRRSRGLNLAVVQAHFACRQLRLGGVDVVRRGGRCQSRKEVRRRNALRCAPIAAVPATRASMLAAPKEQQEHRSKKAHQSARRISGHVAICALNSCSKVPEATSPSSAA